MAEPSNGRSRNERAHIAVVAVHGIGEHEPNASAKSIADLLLRLRHDETNGTENRYTSFRRSELAIPVRRAFTQPEREPEEKRTWRNSFRERSEELEAMTDEFTANDRTGGADHLFMRAQLKEYRSSGQPYETVRYRRASSPRRRSGLADDRRPRLRDVLGRPLATRLRRASHLRGTLPADLPHPSPRSPGGRARAARVTARSRGGAAIATRTRWRSASSRSSFRSSGSRWRRRCSPWCRRPSRRLRRRGSPSPSRQSSEP